MTPERGQAGRLERTLAVVVLTAFAPLVVVASMGIVVVDGFPIVFRQNRAGIHGRPFVLFKLRSMRKTAPPPEQVGQVRPGNHHLLPVIGDLLRRTKLDEVLQLMNVIRGEMRFVGPRPALVSDVDDYTDVWVRRLEVAPGLTGWAQVNGNTKLSWDDRIALDLYYVDHRSWTMDVRIILMTLQTIVLGERVNEINLVEARRHAVDLARRSSID